MQRLPPPSSKAIKPAAERRVSRAADPTLPAILEFQSPSAAMVATPIPRSAQGMIWVITSMFAACLILLGTIRVDRVIPTSGKVVSQAATIVVQPLETAIVRSINVREGQTVRAGDILAQLDPTFAAADVGALANQVGSLQAEVSRLQAEVDGKPFIYSGIDPALSLQAAIYAQRSAEFNFKLENYRQKISGLQATMERAMSDARAYQDRRVVAEKVESMRKELERLQVGSKLNSLAATDSRLEIERGLQDSIRTIASSRGDLDAMKAERDAYVQNSHSETAQKLAEETQKLSDARESLRKAQLRRQLVELRADRDATVLTVSKVSVGSVLQSGDPFITMVPSEAPMEVEVNIAGRDTGFVHVGDPVAIKFDTFPFSQYGMAVGTVRTISADSFTGQDDQRTHSGSVPVAAGSTEPFYRARIAIDEVQLHDVPKDFHIAPGMPVTADIKVGRHTVLNYLMGKILPVAMEGMREP